MLAEKSAGLISMVAMGGAGGGSGDPITPYRQHPNLKEINAQREKTKTWFDNLVLRAGPWNRFFRGLDLCYAKTEKCVGSSVRALTGSDPRGQLVTVALADLKQIRFVKLVDEGKKTAAIQMEATIFPDIAPDELLRAKPKYSDLHSKAVVMSVVLRRDDGAELAFRPLIEDVAVRLSEIQVGSTITASNEKDEYWWAIPSVVADPTFPYRHCTLD